MKKMLIGLIGVSLVVALAGCANNKKAPDVKVDDKSNLPATGGNTGPSTSGTDTTGIKGTGLNDGRGVDPTRDPNNILSKRVIYFDLDRDSVRQEFVPIVQAHARYLVENPGRKIRLEGHADERGSREYNMALGQRRAEAVRRAAGALGVGNDRAETISFGEDKPRATGSDEAAWSQNRRVEIVYDGE
jgi:peptidoglycan-associated lipoprotein